MRIVSFLSSATELICGVGLTHNLVGIPHECNYHNSVVRQPVLTSTHILVDLNSALFDELVFKMLSNEHALYDSDVTTHVNFRPDLIVTQALFNVCALSGCDLARALAAKADRVEFVALKPAGSHYV